MIVECTFKIKHSLLLLEMKNYPTHNLLLFIKQHNILLKMYSSLDKIYR